MHGPDYVGIFRFHFWQFGQWVEILVDDRLPVVAGTNEMVFMHSDEDNEFWSALLEKAYAKLNGCYANLSGGTQGEAMEDVTGGLVETMDLTKKTSEELAKDLGRYVRRCCLMGCSITVSQANKKMPCLFIKFLEFLTCFGLNLQSKEIEAQLNNGLIAGHAYSITGLNSVSSYIRPYDFVQVTYQGKQVKLIRVRNPWGNNYEWKGDWSDHSPQWKSVSEADKQRLQVSFGGDGEFW